MQMGTLGAGNHYAEIQVVEEVFDKAAACKMGIDKVGQVCVMIHSGSRGLGHQVTPPPLHACVAMWCFKDSVHLAAAVAVTCEFHSMQQLIPALCSRPTASQVRQYTGWCTRPFDSTHLQQHSGKFVSQNGSHNSHFCFCQVSRRRICCAHVHSSMYTTKHSVRQTWQKHKRALCLLWAMWLQTQLPQLDLFCMTT